MNKNKFKMLLVNLVMLISLLFLLYESTIFKDIKQACVIITCISFFMLTIHIIQLKCMNVSVISVMGFFLMLNHVFNLGFYYLVAFNKEEYFLFGNWFNDDATLKIKVGFFVLATIQSVFIGYLLRWNPNRMKNVGVFSEEKGRCYEKIIRKCSIVILIISTPFRLLSDYNMIAKSEASGMYIGGAVTYGFGDDLQALFIPGLVGLLYSLRKKKKAHNIVFGIYIFSSLLVMSLSGSRRYYITAIIILLVYYFNEVKTGDNRKKIKIFSYIGLIIAVFILLNFATMIRNYRHSGDILRMMIEHKSELLSLDAIWEAMAEFGITGKCVYYTCYYFPSSIPYQYGKTFLFSLIYILPIGWLIDLKASVGNMIFQLSHNAVGGSLMADMYANFGILSILPAVFLGNIIAKITLSNNDKDFSINKVMGYSVGYFIINYVRSSSLEIFRGCAYTIALYGILYLIMRNRNNKTNS